MRIEELKIFTDVIRYQSMNSAAEKHFMTPQNLSKIIRNMERELDIILFKRSKKGSELTKEGEKFYLQIVKVLNEYEKALEVVSKEASENKGPLEVSKSLTVKVLSNLGATNYAVLGAYKQLKKERQYDIFLDLETIKGFDYRQAVEDMLAKKADVVVCTLPDNDIDSCIKCCKSYIPIYIVQSEFMLIVSKNNPLAKRSMVSVKEIGEYKFIEVKETYGYTVVFGDEVPCVMRVDSMNSAIEQVQYSDEYCTLVCECLLGLNKIMKENEDTLVFVPLAEKFYSTFIVLLREELSDEPAVLDFVRKIGQSFFATSSYT